MSMVKRGLRVLEEGFLFFLLCFPLSLTANVDTRHHVQPFIQIFLSHLCVCIIPTWDVQVKSGQHVVNSQEMCSLILNAWQRVERYRLPTPPAFSPAKKGISNILFYLAWRLIRIKVRNFRTADVDQLPFNHSHKNFTSSFIQRLTPQHHWRDR